MVAVLDALFSDCWWIFQMEHTKQLITLVIVGALYYCAAEGGDNGNRGMLHLYAILTDGTQYSLVI